METFSVLLIICEGNSPVTGEFPAQRPVTRSFDAFFDLRLNKRLSNNGEAGIWNATAPIMTSLQWKGAKHEVSRVVLGPEYSERAMSIVWASYQIRKIAGCVCAGNAGNVFPATDFKENR